ncbi:MAG: BlaI/MecI/CopY family transcriptional regulator [Eubacterium sp.]|jgi:BlaI family penicillinase repressor|nr:BlaI/MecI/CopY family transcriptional regulator [Eubacterium sp.]
MAEYKLGEAEMQFAEFIWENEPITSGELVKLCEEKLSWKKSTTHTVLRRICDKGIFENSGGQVRSLVSKEEFFAGQSEVFVEKTFHGSLPRFLAAFTSRRKISEKEIQEILKIIEDNQIKS